MQDIAILNKILHFAINLFLFSLYLLSSNLIVRSTRWPSKLLGLEKYQLPYTQQDYQC